MAEKGSREGSEEAAPGPEAVTPVLGVAADTDGASLACPVLPSYSAAGPGSYQARLGVGAPCPTVLSYVFLPTTRQRS